MTSRGVVRIDTLTVPGRASPRTLRNVSRPIGLPAAARSTSTLHPFDDEPFTAVERTRTLLRRPTQALTRRSTRSAGGSSARVGSNDWIHRMSSVTVAPIASATLFASSGELGGAAGPLTTTSTCPSETVTSSNSSTMPSLAIPASQSLSTVVATSVGSAAGGVPAEAEPCARASQRTVTSASAPSTGTRRVARA